MESNWDFKLFKNVELSLDSKENILANKIYAKEFTEDDY